MNSGAVLDFVYVRFAFSSISFDMSQSILSTVRILADKTFQSIWIDARIAARFLYSS